MQLQWNTSSWQTSWRGPFLDSSAVLQKCLQSKYHVSRAADSSGSHFCPSDITSES